MELYKVTTATKAMVNVSWDRVCDMLRTSLDGVIWSAHSVLDLGETYEFQTVNGDLVKVSNMD